MSTATRPAPPKPQPTRVQVLEQQVKDLQTENRELGQIIDRLERRN